jgi:hypothetical protein
MSYKELYTLKPSETANGWVVYKVNKDDYEPTGQYNVSDINGRLECDCFASNKSTCRHRNMVRRYKEDPEFRSKIDSKHMWSPDKERFSPPLITGEP